MRIPNEVRRMVERDLRNYGKYQSELKGLLSDIATGAPPIPDGMPKAKGNYSDPTPKAVIGFYGLARVGYLKGVCQAIEHCLFSMAKDAGSEYDRQQMVTMLYFRNTHTVEGVANELGYSRRTIYRWKRELVESIAAELGYIA